MPLVFLEGSRQNPGRDQWRAAKKVMRYRQRTKDCMLMFSICDELEIVGFADCDFAGSPDDIKSTSEYVFKLAG